MKEFPYFIPDGWVATSTIKSTLVSNNSGLRTDSNTWGKALSTSAIVTPNCTQLFKHFSALEVLKEINVMLILQNGKNHTSPLFLLREEGVATQEKASHSRCLPCFTLCFCLVDRSLLLKCLSTAQINKYMSTNKGKAGGTMYVQPYNWLVSHQGSDVGAKLLLVHLRKSGWVLRLTSQGTFIWFTPNSNNVPQ